MEEHGLIRVHLKEDQWVQTNRTTNVLALIAAVTLKVLPVCILNYTQRTFNWEVFELNLPLHPDKHNEEPQSTLEWALEN